MPKVNNSKIISTLSRRSFSSNKIRNIMAVIAIALTTVMLISLFTIGSTMMDASQDASFRLLGTNVHGGFKYMTEEEYDKIKDHPTIQKISYSIPIGMGENKELSKLAVEIRYTGDNTAKWNFSYPTTGTMPIDYKDITASSTVLDALGVPHELGQPLTLEFTVDGKQVTETFTLVGFWEGDEILHAQQTHISKEFQEAVCPVATIPYAEQDSPELFGTMMIDINFSNSVNIEDKLVKILTDSGLDPENTGIAVNWVYMAGDLDISSVLMIALILLVIIFSGYLIIYNIFYISITRDVQYYGLLKTIGTTSRQIKRMIRKQALYLSALGIPIGLTFGYFIAGFLVPVVMKTSTFSDVTKASFNAWIFLLAGLFSLVTVMISTSSPARLAAKTSPIEAIRISDTSISSKKKGHKTKKVSVFSMAFKNVFRNKKKLFSVVISLTLSIVLALSVYSSVMSFDMDLYLEGSTVSDFTIANSDLLKRFEVAYVDDDTMDFVASIDGVEEYGGVYLSEAYHILSESAYDNMLDIVESFPNFKENYTYSRNEKEIPAHIYGIDEIVYDKLELFDGISFDDRFLSGNYVYVTPFYQSEGVTQNSYYSAGDTITLAFENGTKEYTVLGIAKVPYPISARHGHMIEVEVILPAFEYLTQTDAIEPIHAVIDVEDAMEDVVEEKIATYCEDSRMMYTSKAVFIEEFKEIQYMYLAVGGVLVLILVLIGILNFINSTVTSVSVRRTELATLQSVGMTNKQVRKMLLSEGIVQFLIVLALTLTVGQVFVYLFTQAIAGQTWFFNYSFSLTPLAVIVPLLLLIVLLVPIIVFRQLSRESIIERLRTIN